MISGCFRHTVLGGAHGFQRRQNVLRIKEAEQSQRLCATEDRVLFVFSASAGSAMNAGRLTPLFSPVSPLFSTFTDNFVTFDGGNFHADQTILVNQNGVADGQIFREAFYVLTATISFVAYDRFVGVVKVKGLVPAFQGNVVTAFQFDGTFPDLWCRAGIAALCPVLLMTLRKFLDALTVFCIVAERSSGRMTFMPASSIFDLFISSSSVFPDRWYANNFRLFMTVLVFKWRRDIKSIPAARSDGKLNLSYESW